MTTPGNFFGHCPRRLQAMPPKLPEVKTIINGQDPLPGGGFDSSLIFHSFAFPMEWEFRNVELQVAVELLHQV